MSNQNQNVIHLGPSSWLCLPNAVRGFCVCVRAAVFAQCCSWLLRLRACAVVQQHGCPEKDSVVVGFMFSGCRATWLLGKGCRNMLSELDEVVGKMTITTSGCHKNGFFFFSGGERTTLRSMRGGSKGRGQRMRRRQTRSGQPSHLSNRSASPSFSSKFPAPLGSTKQG